MKRVLLFMIVFLCSSSSSMRCYGIDSLRVFRDSSIFTKKSGGIFIIPLLRPSFSHGNNFNCGLELGYGYGSRVELGFKLGYYNHSIRNANLFGVGRSYKEYSGSLYLGLNTGCMLGRGLSFRLNAGLLNRGYESVDIKNIFGSKTDVGNSGINWLLGLDVYYYMKVLRIQHNRINRKYRGKLYFERIGSVIYNKLEEERIGLLKSKKGRGRLLFGLGILLYPETSLSLKLGYSFY